MKDIKIFVSHRIDQIAEQIDNPLFIPVRCGAIFDTRDDIGIVGDDTGDNISHKRMSFNELTVLYWAWKNCKADYYGLCHYRRFLDFGESEETLASSEHDQGCVSVPNLGQDTIERHHLTSDYMREEIAKYDAIFMNPIDLKPLNIKSNYDAMKNSPDWHNIKDVDVMLDVIKEKYPDMYSTAYNYMFTSTVSFLYNCFIMKENIFMDFCTWLFDILFTVEKRIDMSLYTQQQYRTLGTLAERLVGIYVAWLKEQNKYKISHRPLLFVENTQKEEVIKPAFAENNIPIVSNISDQFAPIFSVFLSSVIQHASDCNNYDFIILSDNISEKHKKMLRSQLAGNMSIRFVSTQTYLKDINLIIKHKVYAKIVYFRLIIPQILQEYDKLIVVDADMVCQEDIANVYKEDVEDYLAGAVVDSVMQGYLNGAEPSFKPYALDYMKMEDPYKYINTGFLLFNSKRYRELFSLPFLEKFIEDNMDNVKIYDQDMLNMLLKGQIKFLDCKWNCYTKSNDFIRKCFSLCPLETLEQYNVARNSESGIIHYASQPKPWMDATVDFADVWWKYARMSPCYEEVLHFLIKKQSHRSDNNSFQHIDYQAKILYVLSHKAHFRVQLLRYSIMKHITKGKTRDRYRRKYDKVKSLLREAKRYRQHFAHV